MNIFKALSEGNGKISETNITSFMNYLLDSTNELNNSFFILFAKLIDEQISKNKIGDYLKLNQKSIRSKIIHFSNNFSVSAEPEYSIKNASGKKQIPDILLKVTSKKTEEDILYLIIENKINKGAIKKGQIEQQFNFFSESDDYQEGLPIFSVLISPDELAFENLYIKAKAKNHLTAWLKWVNYKESKNSIESVLRKVIKYEQNAEIQPIDPNTQFIIKSFIDYIATEFSLKQNGKKNFSFKGFDEVEVAYAELNQNKFLIKRYSNNMVRLFDIEDNLLEIEVKPILREINTHYNLEIELQHSTGKSKNTQIFGREVIRGLNKKTE